MKLTPRQAKALNGSIAHWERLATGKAKPKEGPSAIWCDLCDEYNNALHEKDDCKGCPIRNVTGKPYCDGSPFDAAARSFDHDGPGSVEFKTAATAMLNFLKAIKS